MTDKQILEKALKIYPILTVDINLELREMYIKKLKEFYSTKKIKKS